MIINITSGNYRRYETGLAEIYCQCFAEAPWLEKIEPIEAKVWFREMLSLENNLSFVFVEDLKLKGGWFSFPLELKDDVKAYFQNFDRSSMLYLAEAFVGKEFRNKGIATDFLELCLKNAKSSGFTHACVRTNVDSKMHPILIKSDFEITAYQTVMSKKVIEGREGLFSDERGLYLRAL